MTIRKHVAFLPAVALVAGIFLTPAAFAQETMKHDTMKSDTMKSGAMKGDAMKHDTMKSNGTKTAH